MKLTFCVPLLAAAVAFASDAQASDARIELRAFVPTSCTMTFSKNLQQLSDDSFSLGTVDQFCNTNYQLTLYHEAAGAGSKLQFGNRLVGAASTSTMLESSGRPVNASKQLMALGVDESTAAALGRSMVLQVTPLAL